MTPADWLAMYRARDRAFGPISEGAWRILIDLAERGPCRVTSAALGAGLPLTTGLRMMGELEQRGLVSLKPDRNDRRATIITLTPTAAALLAKEPA